MASGYPALMIRPPESPVQQMAGVQQVIGGQQQIQAQQLENQQRQNALADRDALTKAMAQWDGQNYADLPNLVTKVGGSGSARLQASNAILDIQQKKSAIAKDDAVTANTNAEADIKKNDQYRGRILAVVGIQDPQQKQAAWDAEIAAEEKAQNIQPGTVSRTYPGDQQAIITANHFAIGSQIMKEMDDKQRLAIDAWKPVQGQLVNAITGEKIGNFDANRVSTINQGLSARWAVLNPGNPIPSYFQLQSGDGPSQFDQIDKIMEQTERSKATVAQQQTTNAIRAQTFELARDKQDMKPVQGIDPRSGQSVILPASQAQQLGIQNPMQASDEQVSKAMAARHWLNLALKPADPTSKDPADQSITQLIDNLDKEGKLGPLASRWNDFMAGKFGAGDKEYAALNAKMGLSSTLLQNAHVGNRGGAQLLEHFEDLANQKKMDGPTLTAGFKSEINYMKDKAADPNPPDYNSIMRSNFQKSAATAGAGRIQVKDPQGGIHTFADQASADRFKKLAGIQ